MDAMIPIGDRCPPSGKNRCPYRGYFSVGDYDTSLTYCRKYKDHLLQGKTKASQRKCKQCLEAGEGEQDGR